MSTPLERFREYLAGSGKRLTTEREIVAARIFALRSPFTAEAVLSAIDGSAHVSRATVHRTISMLTDSGQIIVQSESGPEVVYTHA